jgi:hypothetical protein
VRQEREANGRAATTTFCIVDAQSVNGAIVRMADHECGADVLNALTRERVAEVKKLGFMAAAEIVTMIDHPCGVQVLDWLTKENVQHLNTKSARACVEHVLKSNLKEMKFTQKQVNTLMSHSQGCSLLVMRGQAIPCCLGIPAECLSGGVYMLSATEANQVQGPTA